MPWILGIIAGAAALYFLTGGSRVPVAEGRSWRLAAGASQVDWARVYPDAVARLAAARAAVLVAVVSKEHGARVPVVVEIDGANGPSSFRGRFVETAEQPIPRPWGPSPGAPVIFELADVIHVVRD